MNLISFVSQNDGAIEKGGKKLTQPQKNLLGKLDAMGVEMSSIGSPRVVTNNNSGYVGLLHPFIAALVEWVYEVYSTYHFGPMHYRRTSVSIQTFDRVRYLILALDNQAFRDFID
jgi:hypothetical protein